MAVERCSTTTPPPPLRLINGSGTLSAVITLCIQFKINDTKVISTLGGTHCHVLIRNVFLCSPFDDSEPLSQSPGSRSIGGMQIVSGYSELQCALRTKAAQFVSLLTSILTYYTGNEGHTDQYIFRCHLFKK